MIPLRTSPAWLRAVGALAILGTSFALQAQISSLTKVEIENPIVGSVANNADGSITVTAGGGDTWNNSDSFTFLYQQKTGDFDVKVRVKDVSADNPGGDQRSAKGSLHVRANLTGGSPNLQVNALPPTPGANAIETIYRPLQDGGTDDMPDSPTSNTAPDGSNTYPDVWLRIKREGNKFTTYYSNSTIGGGTNAWSVFSSVVVDPAQFPDTLYVGLGAVAHNDDINSSQKVRVTFSDFMNVPAVPTGTADGQPVAVQPGPYPVNTVAAVNWNISLPADGIGYTADKTQSGKIVWNTGGFGTISRDILLSIDGQEGPTHFVDARYACGALDFGISPQDPVAGQANLGPYTNPNRLRYSAPAPTDAPGQAWLPSTRHGIVLTTARKQSQVQWNDGASAFYGHTFVAVDFSSTKHFSMLDGTFGNGEFYVRMSKLGDVGPHPDAGANSSGGFQRAAFNIATAWFPFHQGWIGGYFNDANRGPKASWSRHASFSPGLASLLTVKDSASAVLEWSDLGGAYGGLATLNLPGINSRTGGMIFAAANDDNTTRGSVASAVPNDDGNGWTVAIRSLEENKGDPNTYAAAGSSEFSFVYVPWDSIRLVGGFIKGSDGSKIKSAGTYTLTRLEAGKYLLQIPGKTGVNGMLILNNAGWLAGSPGVADTGTLAYEYDSERAGFVIVNRHIVPGGGQTVGGVTYDGFPSVDTDFQFAYVDFTNPLAPPGSEPPSLSVTRTASQITISWPASFTGFTLESSSALPASSWTTVSGVVNNSVTVTPSDLAKFYRLRK